MYVIFYMLPKIDNFPFSLKNWDGQYLVIDGGPEVEGNHDDILLQEVVDAEEEAGPAAHDEGPAVEVDHHRPTLPVSLRRVHVQTK